MLIAAELAKTARRSTDSVARIGGEEFALILPGTDSLEAAQLAESIRLGVQTLGIRHSGLPAEATVTISLGVATAIGDNFLSADGLVGGADSTSETAPTRAFARAVASRCECCLLEKTTSRFPYKDAARQWSHPLIAWLAASPSGKVGK